MVGIGVRMAEEQMRTAKEQSDKLSFTERQIKFLTDLRDFSRMDDNDRESWKTKQMISHSQRLGINRYAEQPYDGAPDVPLPETDKLIKQAVAKFVLSAWSPKKMALLKFDENVEITPEMKEKKKRAEAAFNKHLRSKKLDWFKKLHLAADFVKEKGMALFRVYEDFKTRTVHKVIEIDKRPPEEVEAFKSLGKEDKKIMLSQLYDLDIEDDSDVIEDIIKQFDAGERVIEFDIVEYSSYPNVEVPLPNKVVVPGFTTDIEEAIRIKYKFEMARHEVEESMEDGTFLKKDLDNISMENQSEGSGDDRIEQQKKQEEGVFDNDAKKDLYGLEMIETWYSEKENEPARRWVFIFLADVGNVEEALVYSKPFHFEFEGWDWVKHDNETRDPRYHESRGVPEQIQGIQEVMEKQVKSMLIRDEYNNKPVWFLPGAHPLRDRHNPVSPGEILTGDQKPDKLTEYSQVDMSSERILGLFKSYAEEYMGSNDLMFRNSSNMGANTLGEIKEGIRQNAPQTNLEVIAWNMSLGKVYQKMFEIFKERVGESIYVDDMEVRPEDFDIPVEVVSNGTLEIADQGLMAQKALQRMEIATKMMEMGVADQMDMYNAYVDYLEKDGVRQPDDYATNPQEIMQGQLAQMQQQLQQMQQQAMMLNDANEKATKKLAQTKSVDVKRRVQNVEAMKEEIANAQNEPKENNASS